MKANRSKDTWKYFLPEKSKKSLAILATLFVCFIISSAQAQVTGPTEKADIPLNSKSELNKQQSLPKGFPILKDTGDPEADRATYNSEKAAWIAENPELYESMVTLNLKDSPVEQNSVEPLPIMGNTGNFEADKAAYRLAVDGWLERNGSLYTNEELEFLKKPILKLEERERTLKNL